MSPGRGPDFADELTAEQRQMLSDLRAKVTQTRRRPGKWSYPIGVAAGVVLISLIVTVSSFMLRPERTGIAPGATATSPFVANVSSVLGLLEAATAKVAEAPAGNAILYRQELDIVTVACAATATESESWISSGDRAKPASGRLVVKVVQPPGGVWEAAACPPSSGSPAKTLFDGQTTDEPAEWKRLRGEHAQLLFPRRAGARWVGETLGLGATWSELEPSAAELERRLTKLCANFKSLDCASLRWTVLAEMLSSPETSQAQRRAAFETAGSVAVNAALAPEVTKDVTGRRGVTLRVPYYLQNGSGLAAAGVLTTAELTFDEGTGALLQRTIFWPQEKRVDFTVYLAAERT